MRIGIFGGTFDPIHNGHLGALRELQEHLELDRVHWVLSARPPHKNDLSTSIEHRFEMLQQALQAYPHYIADDHEIARDAKSYTIDTVFQFRQDNPDADLILIIGADSMHRLDTWHRALELIDMVNIVVMNRPGYALEPPSWVKDRLLSKPAELLAHRGGKLAIFESSAFDISSTEIRAQISDSKKTKIAQQNLPPEVYHYILRHQLYEMHTMNPQQIKNHVVDALENIKGVDIKVIDIADISDFADYMIVASGTSNTHVKALAREASNNLRQAGVNPLNETGADLGEWVLVDFGDVVLHVMRPEVREYYDLEKLWDEDVRNLVKAHREKQDQGA